MTQREVTAFLVNLQLLGYKPPTSDFFTDVKFFEISHKSQFEEIVQFLFKILDAEKAETMFKNCTPCVNHQRSQEFRTACVNWWKSIANENPNLNLPKVSGMMLKDLRGPAIAKLMHRFSMFVLKTETERLSSPGDSCLHFMPSCSGVLLEIQKSTLQASANAEFKKFVHLMQIVQKEEENLNSFVGTHVKSYRETIKKNKELRTIRDKLLQKEPAIKMTPSKRGKLGQNFTETDYNIFRKALNKHLSTNRKMNKKLSNTLEEIQHGQAVVNQIKRENEEGKVALNANEINACVPSLLVQKHTKKVYEKIGKSLYTNGALNLQSMAGLFNLSLCLLNEKMHSVGLPNFESDLQSVQAQSHIQSKNKQTLRDVQENLHLQNPIMQSRIAHLEHQLNDKMKFETTAKEFAENVISPQKFPWSNREKAKFTPSKIHFESPMPMVSYGMKSNLIHIPSPAKNNAPEIKQKPIIFPNTSEKTHKIQKAEKKLPTRLNSPRRTNRKHVPQPKKKIVIQQPQTLQSPEETAIVVKQKTKSEQAMNQLASTIANAIVSETPKSNENERVFAISEEISDKAFKSAPMLGITPPSANDSVFIHDTPPNYIGTKTFKPLIHQGSSFEYDKENVSSENEATNVDANTTVTNENNLDGRTTSVFNTPLSTISINSRFLRTQSQLTSATDSSATDEPQLHVWKNFGQATPMDTSFDLLNFEIPTEMNQSCSSVIPTEETLLPFTPKPSTDHNRPPIVATANLLDFSIQDIPDNNGNDLPKTEQLDDICLIDFSTF